MEFSMVSFTSYFFVTSFTTSWTRLWGWVDGEVLDALAWDSESKLYILLNVLKYEAIGYLTILVGPTRQ